MRTFDFIKQFSMFATLAPGSGGSAPSRWMIRALYWPKLLMSGAVTFLLVVAGVVGLLCFERSGERTYYGPHSSILRVGERVATASSGSGVVEADPAWD
jgi:hypothetical protein